MTKSARYLLMGVILLCANAFFFIFQQKLHPVHCAITNDCYWYARMSRDFISHQFTYVIYPFEQRPLYPYLASLLSPDHIQRGFRIINWLSVNLAVVLLSDLWLRLKVPVPLICVGFFWLFVHPAGITFFFQYVGNTDLLGYVFNALLLYVVISRSFLWLIVLAPLGTLERESFMFLILLLMACEFWHFTKTKYIRPLLYCCTAWLIAMGVNAYTKYYLFPHNGETTFRTALYWGKVRFQHPLEIVQWINASLGVLGGFTVLGCLIKAQEVRKDITFLTLFGLALTYFVFGFFGGTDMTRIIFDGFPFIATALFYAANKKVLARYETALIVFLFSLLTLFIMHICSNFIEYDFSVWVVMKECVLLVVSNVIAVMLFRRTKYFRQKEGLYIS